MTALAVIFIVLMILAIVPGVWGWDVAHRPLYGSLFLLWLCVAILGWIVLNSGGSTPSVPIR